MWNYWRQVCASVYSNGGRIRCWMMEIGVQVCPEVPASQWCNWLRRADLFLTADSLEHSDRKVKYCTDLPSFATLKLVFWHGLNMSRGALTFQETFIHDTEEINLLEVDLGYLYASHLIAICWGHSYIHQPPWLSSSCNVCIPWQWLIFDSIYSFQWCVSAESFGGSFHQIFRQLVLY